MKRLWLAFAAVLLFSFSVLGWVGTRIYQEAPPLPDRVVITDGTVFIPSDDIGKGQNVWQAMGGMEVGSIWGHGSYVAPDWSADWLHRECVFILNEWAKTNFQKEYDQIDPEQQAQLQKRLERLMRTNTFDPATQTITVAGRCATDCVLGGDDGTTLFLLTSNSWQPSETSTRQGRIEAVEVEVPGPGAGRGVSP